jgi:hypothetical protein
MNCFARWKRGRSPAAYFRDQTVLQFGGGWDLLASFILLNPGSAMPAGQDSQNEFLAAKRLPYFVTPRDGEQYFAFTIDPLMRSLVQLFSPVFPRGVIKLYNLFNFRNQDSSDALADLERHSHEPAMFSNASEILFAGRPVVIAAGRAPFAVARLGNELRKYVSLCDPSLLYTVSKIGTKKFAVTKAQVGPDGLVDSFHPSHTCKYGNSTAFDGFHGT